MNVKGYLWNHWFKKITFIFKSVVMVYHDKSYIGEFHIISHRSNINA